MNGLGFASVWLSSKGPVEAMAWLCNFNQCPSLSLSESSEGSSAPNRKWFFKLKPPTPPRNIESLQDPEMVAEEGEGKEAGRNCNTYSDFTQNSNLAGFNALLVKLSLQAFLLWLDCVI